MHVLRRAEIVNGTGFDRHARFVLVTDKFIDLLRDCMVLAGDSRAVESAQTEEDLGQILDQIETEG